MVDMSSGVNVDLRTKNEKQRKQQSNHGPRDSNLFKNFAVLGLIIETTYCNSVISTAVFLLCHRTC
jgi:hypothetical protein